MLSLALSLFAGSAFSYTFPLIRKPEVTSLRSHAVTSTSSYNASARLVDLHNPSGTRYTALLDVQGVQFEVRVAYAGVRIRHGLT